MQFDYMLHIQFRQLAQGYYLTWQQVLRDLVIDFAQVNGFYGEFEIGVAIGAS